MKITKSNFMIAMLLIERVESSITVVAIISETLKAALGFFIYCNETENNDVSENRIEKKEDSMVNSISDRNDKIKSNYTSEASEQSNEILMQAKKVFKKCVNPKRSNSKYECASLFSTSSDSISSLMNNTMKLNTSDEDELLTNIYNTGNLFN